MVPRPIKLLGIGAGLLLLLAAVVALIGYLSAPHFYLTRTIFWRESDNKDLERFPARAIHNAPPVSKSCPLTTPTPPRSKPSGIAAPTAAWLITLSRAGRRHSLSSTKISWFSRGTSMATTKPPSTPPSLWPSPSL